MGQHSTILHLLYAASSVFSLPARLLGTTAAFVVCLIQQASDHRKQECQSKYQCGYHICFSARATPHTVEDKTDGIRAVKEMIIKGSVFTGSNPTKYSTVVVQL